MSNIKKIFEDSIAVKSEIIKLNSFNAIEEMGYEIVKAIQNGNKLMLCGNGGSAADAQHLAAEFVSKLSKDRDPLAAEALTVDTSVLTAIGNDYGYDKVFSRQIEGKLTKNDIFLGITTSGNSLNIINALDVCKKMGIPTIVFSGNDGGTVLEKADYCIVPPGHRTSTIQEVHIVLAHSICECVEKEIFNF